jgi:hypothetical protein
MLAFCPRLIGETREDDAAPQVEIVRRAMGGHLRHHAVAEPAHERWGGHVTPPHRRYVRGTQPRAFAPLPASERATGALP